MTISPWAPFQAVVVPQTSSMMIPFGRLFAGIAIVVAAARLVGWVFQRYGQPRVLGEIVAGILLGDAVLNKAHLFGHHHPTNFLFPMSIQPSFNTLGGLGIALFMFIIGMELDLTMVRGRGRLASSVSLTSIAIPFGLGVLVAIELHHSGFTQSGGAAFVLFIGTSMSLTALPVLARILSDRGMLGTPLGTTAMASAAIDDIVAWTLLAIVLVVAQAQGKSSPGTHPHLLYVLPYLAGMWFIVRPAMSLLQRWYDARGRLTPDILAAILVGLLLSAFATDWMGIHYIFGAFLFGIVMPRKGQASLLPDVVERLEQVCVLLLLPLFFLVTGLTVTFGHLGWTGLAMMILVLAAAITGKFAGAYLGARAQRVPHRRAAGLAVLMNTRGLTELIVLKVGMSAGIIGARVFSLFVVMAVVTTVMTGPLFRLIYSDAQLGRDLADAERARLNRGKSFRLLVVIDAVTEEASPALHLAQRLAGATKTDIVLAHVQLRTRSALEIGAGLTADLVDAAEIALRLAALERVCVDAGHPVVVLSRMSSNIATDLAAMVDVAHPELIIMMADSNAVASTQAASQCPVLTVERVDGTVAEGAVLASVDIGPAGSAVTEAAIRLAMSTRDPLRFVDARRNDERATRQTGTALAAAAAAGLTARVLGPDDAVGIVLTPHKAAFGPRRERHPGTLWITVSSRQDRDASELVAIGKDLLAQSIPDGVRS